MFPFGTKIESNSPIQYYYIHEDKLDIPVLNFPFHEMPIMDLYALIYSSLNFFGSLNEIRNINYLLNQKGIVSCLLEAVVSQKIIFPSSRNFDQNYASLVALFRDKKMITFHLTAQVITSTVLTSIL